MKRSLLFLTLLFSLSWSITARGQTIIPGDSIVFGPMMSPVYENSVRVWVLTKNNTGSGNVLSISLTGSSTPQTTLSGTVFNSDDRLGYSLRSYEYTNLTPNETYTANLLINGTPSNHISTIKNENNLIDDFEFLSGGCARIYDLSRCIDQPESAFHINGDPEIFNVMANEGSDMMIWLGDATYLLGLQHAMGQCPDGVDDWANKDMAFDRYMFYRKFHDNLIKAMPQLAITDNHDLGPNEFNKNMPTIAAMREIFMDWWPNPEYNSTPEGQGLFSSYKYKDVEYFLLDNRSYRDNTLQHLGPDQMAWLKTALLNSTATFKVLINGTPSFERNCGGRNFCASGQSVELINYIKNNNINGVLSLSADIHEQKFMIREGDVKYPLYDVLSGNLNSDVGSGNYIVNYNSDYVLTGVKQTYVRINVFGEEGDRRMKIEYVGLDGQPYFETIIHEEALTSQNSDAHNLAMNINNSVADTSEFNHTIQSSNVTYETDRNNAVNGALRLTQSTDIQIANSNPLDLHSRAFSLSFWMNPEVISSNGATLFSNATANTGISIGIDGNGKLIYKNHATGATQASQYSILPNTWSYVVWKYDNVRRKLSLYYNGFLIQSWTNVASPTESSANIRIGNNFEGKRFLGLVDDLSLYGRIISDEDIMNEADIESNRGDVLKVTGAQAMFLPPSITNQVLSEDFTIEFWGKLNADPGTNFKILASNGRVNGNSTGISFEFPNSNKLNVVVGTNGAGWNTISEQGDVWNIGEWNHIALSATKNGTMSYYVNGVKIAEGAFAEYVPNPFGLGFGYSPSYGSPVNAELDDIRIWERALTVVEIKQRMHHPLSGTEEDLAVYYDFSPHEDGDSIMSSGTVQHEMALAGGTLIAATSPVGNITPEYQNLVVGKWSKNNAVNNSGLILPDAITAYNSNVVIGKSADAAMEVVPGNAAMFYLKGGWRIDPLNSPFATLKINLQESLAQFDSINSIPRDYYLLKAEAGAFVNVADGSFDGQNVTFYNTNLQDAVYHLAWSEGATAAGRGSSLSLAGGHQVHIPRTQINPIFNNNFTLEFWVALTQDPGNNDKLVSNHGRVNNNSTGFTIEIPSNNTISASFGTNGANWNAINSGTPVTIGEWNHIAITAAPNQAIKMYVNGELKASNPYTAYVANDLWDLSLGNSINYGGQTFSIMDEFRIWNRVKTQEEIKSQMHALIDAADENLVFNYTFDQENTGTLINTGTLANSVAYQNAQIIPATSPVSEINLDFPDKMTGSWSVQNENDNGLYVKDPISSFTQNVVFSRDSDEEILALGTAVDTSYVAGGWHLNALNIENATIQVDLSKVFTDVNAINSIVLDYFLLRGDPTGNYQFVGTGTEVDGKVNFDNLPLALGNYYLAFTTDENAAIVAQGGAIELDGGHQVFIPKEGVNTALSGAFTIEMWARLKQSAGANTKLVGFSGVVSGSHQGWEMEFLGNQTLQTITGKGPAGGWNSLNSTQVWNIDEWNHTAVTFTPNGEFKFYINGELASSTPVGSFYPNANDLALGKNIANNAESKTNIDEFRIWNRAKTIEEIRGDMYLTITEPTQNLVYNYTFNQENNGFLLNSGSQNVEVGYTNAAIIPSTGPVRNIQPPFRNKVRGNWSVKSDSGNGLYLQEQITSKNSNVIIGKETGSDILPALGLVENDTLYLDSRWWFDALFIESATPKVDLTKVFSSLNEANLIASEYFLLKGNPAQELEIIATGTKENNIVTFSQIALDSVPVYLAWKKDATLPNGTFPIVTESLWKYDDSGNDLGTDWRASGYDDSAWAFGNAIFGYGDNNENTTLDYGPDPLNKRITTYLRHTFEVENAAQYGSLIFNVLRDDGVVVYVNETEAFRMNMPQGEVNYTTLASTAINGADETAFNEVITTNLLQDGVNVIAVELHQAAANSSDLSFDMSVSYELPPIEITPYPLAQDSEWYYLDNGSNLDNISWNELASDNENWSRGFGPLGYGDPVNTIISYGPNATNKYITSYFYKDIEVNTATIAATVEFGLKRDDGAVVYVNGVEVFRDNMPIGDITYLTNSATTVDGANENRYFTHEVPSTVFQEGVNRIAVEVHNRDGQSSDLKFDLYIKDAPGDISICQEPHIACFTSITPTGQTNKLIIPQEHRFQLLFKQGENYTIGTGAVPGNHDFAGYVPISGSSTEGYLSVNHENTPGGVSIVDLHLDTATDLWVKDATQAVDMYNNDLVTTSRNCSGGITPWGTIVTSEESTNAGDSNGDGYQDVGWLVEIDPATSQVKEYGNGKQEKLWAMGRMNHENIVVTADGTTAYYGEDGGTHCVYKFVADTPGNLYSGNVYVLKLDLPLSSDEPSSGTAQWIQVPNDTFEDRNNLNIIAGALGGTNFNGVEDCEISPLDGKIYFTSKGKGRVYRFKDNGTAVSEFETVAGGMSYPITTSQDTVNELWGGGNDNLTFDDKGNLWVLQDGGNNYIWVIRPDHTQNNPNILLFASMPAGSEPTGLTFTPDFKYGFFSIQHPNGNSAPQQDATMNDVIFNASATVVFSLKENLGLQAPLADFVADQVQIPEGETVTFTDLSTNNPTSWQWTFEGGTPAVSTEESPTITYNTAGIYNVSLVTSNAAGSSAEAIKVGYIIVEEELGIDVPQLGDIISIYPNPTKGEITIELRDEAGQNVSIEVFDLLGRRITQFPNIQTTGINQKINVDLSDSIGEQMLIIQIKIGEKSGSYKILKAD